MKRAIIISIVAFIASLASVETVAQENASRNDSIAIALKLTGLQSRKDKLEKTIKAEDSKRNSQITGVSPETLEVMNNRQDSLCLALRSELVDVILEIKELSPEVATPQLLQQYNILLNRKDENPARKENNDQTSPSTSAAKKSEK